MRLRIIAFLTAGIISLSCATANAQADKYQHRIEGRPPLDRMEALELIASTHSFAYAGKMAISDAIWISCWATLRAPDLDALRFINCGANPQYANFPEPSQAVIILLTQKIKDGPPWALPLKTPRIDATLIPPPINLGALQQKNNAHTPKTNEIELAPSDPPGTHWSDATIQEHISSKPPLTVENNVGAKISGFLERFIPAALGVVVSQGRYVPPLSTYEVPAAPSIYPTPQYKLDQPPAQISREVPKPRPAFIDPPTYRVNGYRRADGTYVDSYRRTYPDGNPNNNLKPSQ